MVSASPEEKQIQIQYGWLQNHKQYICLSKLTLLRVYHLI